MPFGSYEYVADDGTVYQISVPVDFADALGMTPATGFEPYLDNAISPRYAWWRSAAGISRQAVIGTQAGLAALPNPITVGTVTYNLSGSQGQSIQPLQSPLLLCPQGPQGAQGEAGVLGLYTATIPANVTLDGSGEIRLATVDLPAGKYLISWYVFVQGNDQGTLFLGSLTKGYYLAAPGLPNCLEIYQVTQTGTIPYTVLVGPETIFLDIVAPSGGIVVQSQYQEVALLAVKYA
jgi:hypothetical protein